MNVIRHQAVAKQRDAVALRAFAESFEIETPVVVEQEDVLAIVAPLRDVMRHTRQTRSSPGSGAGKRGRCRAQRSRQQISSGRLLDGQKRSVKSIRASGCSGDEFTIDSEMSGSKATWRTLSACRAGILAGIPLAGTRAGTSPDMSPGRSESRVCSTSGAVCSECIEAGRSASRGIYSYHRQVNGISTGSRSHCCS